MCARLNRYVVTWFSVVALAAVNASASAQDGPAPAGREQVARGIERGLAVVQKGARSYPTHRKCFACHHQTLPLLAVTEARDAGRPTDDLLPAEILKFVDTSFRGKLDELKAGEGIGGKGLTVGYGLWTFRLGSVKPDELTEAMVTYLLKLQEADGHWVLHSIRPPAEESLVMITTLAAAGIKSYATEKQREPATAALNKARAWLAGAKIETHEDQVARLWGLALLGGDTDEQLAAARKALRATQRPDGGWAQLPDMESDAYATGATLYVLLDTTLPPLARGGRGGRAQAQFENALDRTAAASQPVRNGECGVGNDPDKTGAAAVALDPDLARAVDWLLKNQLEDGSWHVTTRAKPVQVYFDNGDPHGKDQFLSMAATGWSTAALARTLREP